MQSWENAQKGIYPGVGHYEIPELLATPEVSVDNWISFNYARGCEEPEIHGVHFFVDDYQFLRVWNTPDRYLPMLKRFQAVCAPDFSVYSDFPRALQIWNHYRKHWLGAYWQENGITVIPTITWSMPDSYEWCFDGEPVGSVVALSTVGDLTRSKETRAALIRGYEEMEKRLSPTQVILYGKIPEELRDRTNIVRVQAFTDKWNALKQGAKQNARRSLQDLPELGKPATG